MEALRLRARLTCMPEANPKNNLVIGFKCGWYHAIKTVAHVAAPSCPQMPGREGPWNAKALT
eukprot:503007-Amphidinium_carterae.1